MATTLPPGFTEDKPSSDGAPPGFTIDVPQGAKRPDVPAHFYSPFAGVDPILAAPQGLLNYPEGAYQWLSHFGILPRPPESVLGPARRYRTYAGSSWPATVGQMVGGAAPALLAPELSPLVTTAMAVGASQLQPVDERHFGSEHALDALLSLIFGRWMGRPVQQARHDVVTAANLAKTQQDAADIAATRQANKTALEAHKQAQASDVAAALGQRQARLTAKSQVPGQTTSGWWDRTLKQIGVSDPTAIRAAPESGARVRNIVGGRMNEITDRMHLDPSDPTFTDQLNTIRDETLKELNESDQAGWYKAAPERDIPGVILDPTTGRLLPRITTPTSGGRATGDFVTTVMEPLAKGPLTGRALTNYISRLGDRAEELARRAGTAPQSERASLYARADALRDIQDAVIGHAAGGNAGDKAALQDARRAYMMWAAGNDAARASRAGIASPAQLITALSRRFGRGQVGAARYNEALSNPQSPYHETANWLQGQLGQHTASVPNISQTKAAIPARTPPTPAPDPTPRPQQDVPAAPNRPRRGIPTALAHGGAAAALGAMHHPILGAWEAYHAIRNLLQPGGGGTERAIEKRLRQVFTQAPRLAGPAAVVAGEAAPQTRRNLPTTHEAAQAAARAARAMMRMYAGAQTD